MGIKDTAPGEFEADPVDAGQRSLVGGEDAAGEVDGNGGRMVPGQRLRGDATIEVKDKGPESLPELAPMATYMTLAPFVGPTEAYERAIEESDKW
jgi:hypothetical protein